jgi:PKD repeat protein
VPPGETLAGFKWLFGDEMQGGGKAELGAASVQHTYQTPGDYTVSLTAVMVSGKEYTAERTIVVRKPSLSACLTTSRVTVQAGGGVQFDSSCSTGLPSSYLWDVRSDSQTGNALAQSTTPSYVYVFDTVGSYTVTLTIKDQFGDQDKKSISITVTP